MTEEASQRQAGPGVAAMARASVEDDAFVGVDGTRHGWVWVAVSSGQVTCGVATDARALLTRFPRVRWLSIDVPIGLPDAGPRTCDRLARAFLGPPRSRSVFSAPVRGVLAARRYDEAAEIHRRSDGRSLSMQTYHLLPKIRDVDGLLRAAGSPLRDRWTEVHPELSFARWNGGRAMVHAKRTPAGRDERRTLVDARWPGAFGRCRDVLRGRGVAADDLLDAFAAAWSAERRRDGLAVTLPPVHPECDACGLRMEIVT